MPEPDRTAQDLVPLVRDAVLLQEGAMDGTRLLSDLPREAMLADLDSTMIGQALTNLLKNAGEALESLAEKGAPEGHVPTIEVRLFRRDGTAVVAISDNGIGLPEDRARLFEPYVTTREKGTGLGLPIVKKIIEEHGGTLVLTDAEPLDDTTHRGARAEVTLPLAPGNAKPETPEPAVERGMA
jgi:two-component system nitrogen regulation sensor histidine kinase NtrY